MTFTSVELTCPQCGGTFEGLDIWAGYPCARCSRAQYAERMARINNQRPYRVDSIGGMCPTQSEGLTADGRPFYFRARHGDWTLEVGPPGYVADYGLWAARADTIATGDDPSDGAMTDDAVLAILDRAFGTSEHHRPESPADNSGWRMTSVGP